MVGLARWEPCWKFVACAIFLNLGAVKGFRFLLWPFALLYGAGVYLRNLAFDRGWKKAHRVGVPVISVGNITVGGTGKTPMAEFLLGKLQAMGRRPAYLSRGYGRSSKGYLLVDPAQADGLRYGDEALQVARRYPALPVAVCEDRVEGARRLITEEGADVIVLDDAFQHRRIHRDLDLVMVDATRLPCDDALLPMGRLREPVSNLDRAQAVVLSKLPPEWNQEELYRHRALTVHSNWELTAFVLQPVEARSFSGDVVISLEELGQYSGIAFSGLGNNAYFFRQVDELLGECTATVPFRDHHAYTANDRTKILGKLPDLDENNSKFDGPIILTTEKDYMRLRSLPGFAEWAELPLYYLQVRLQPHWALLEQWENIEHEVKEILDRYGKN